MERFRDTYAIARWQFDTANDLIFAGFLGPGGRWVIEKHNIADLDSCTVTFARGEEDFSTAWTNRAALSYIEYNVEF